MFNNKLKYILFIIFTLIILVVTVIFFLFQYYDVKIELVDRYVIEKLDWDNAPVWLTLRNDVYDPWVKIEYISKKYGIKLDKQKFDFDKYTYAVVVGHELVSLKYSFSDAFSRKYIIIPDQFNGRVTLKSGKTNNIYIYKFKRMNIDCDYHDLGNIQYVD